MNAKILARKRTKPRGALPYMYTYTAVYTLVMFCCCISGANDRLQRSDSGSEGIVEERAQLLGGAAEGGRGRHRAPDGNQQSGVPGWHVVRTVATHC